MPMFDFDCKSESCGQRFEVMVGGALGLQPPKECPDCGSKDFVRAWTFDGHVSRTEFDDPSTRAMHMQHKRWVEKQAREGKVDSIIERGPLEYRPEIPRRLY